MPPGTLLALPKPLLPTRKRRSCSRLCSRPRQRRRRRHSVGPMQRWRPPQLPHRSAPL